MALQTTFGVVGRLDGDRGTSRGLSRLRVCLQQSVVTGLVAAVSIAAAIPSLGSVIKEPGQKRNG